jgi:hypothetical protein
MNAFEARQLLMDGEHGTLLPEFTICGVVIDLLAVDEHSLRGYEIKASTDRVTDRRFHFQLQQYSATLEFLSYVIAPRFLEHCEVELPDWVGITRIDEDCLTVLRPPQPNPELNLHRFAHLLWRPEAAALLKSIDSYLGVKSICSNGCYAAEAHAALSKKCTGSLVRVLLERMPEDELRLRVRGCVASRSWTAERRITKT